MILILGSNGYLGKWTMKILQNKGVPVFGCNVRLSNITSIKDIIGALKCTHVICAAGISGKPTIDWCEEHEIETFNTNVLDVLNLVRLCNDLDVHLTIYGSGLVYSGYGSYTEDDEPNYYEKVYTRYRILLEHLLKKSPYTNWLYLRIIFPCTFDGNPKCFFEKLKTKPYVHDISVPITCVPYMFDLLPDLLLDNTAGIYNFVNKGTIHLSELNPNAILKEPDEHSRGAYELDVTKLSDKLGIEIKCAQNVFKTESKNI